ncbi:hypothetical protein [Desulfonatronovibrio hydrogenovorans]|uniref:flagellin N-terminal helical domain-containing protein n=1 Tax=Desulfonatronovibrio hydrogenovorans TaxID=53245 RepID=UPI00048CCCA1|nr:hypothetical protein [Desulfonatronovibrio hydrogenovorans]
MSLMDLERYLLYSTSVQLWQQDMLINAYFHGSSIGKNLREMMIGRPPVKPLTNPFDEAITGKLRADSAAIRQHSKNVQEAAQVMGVAAEGVGLIKDTLAQMDLLATKVKNDELDWEDAEQDYNALKDKIQNIVQNTKFNDLALLDGSQWGKSSAAKEGISKEGMLYIHSLTEGGFNLSFRDLSEKWDDLQGSALEDEADLDGQISLLEGLHGLTGTLEDIYTSRKSSLEYQANALESQADIMDQAVEARRQTPTLSLEEILLRILHKMTGNLIDETG